MPALDRQIHEALIAALEDSPYLDLRDGFLQWCEDVCWARNPETNEYEPFRYNGYQREEWTELLRTDTDGHYEHLIVGTCWPRRYGKSQIAAYYDIWRCLHFKFQRVVIAANDEEQGLEAIYNEWIRKTIRYSPELRKLEDRGEIEVLDGYCRFTKTDSVIEVVTSAKATKVGRRITVLHRTESCMVKDDELSAACESAMGDSRDTLTIVDSNIGPDGSPVNELKKQADEGVAGVAFSYIAHADLDAALRDAPPHISRPWLRLMFRRLQPSEFKRNHLNLPTGAGGAPWELLLGNAPEPTLDHPCHPSRARQYFHAGRYALVGGLDKSKAWSLKKSRTIWTVVAVGTAANAEEILTQWQADGEDVESAEPPLAVVVLESTEIPKGPFHEAACRTAIKRSVDRCGGLLTIGLESYECDALHEWCLSQCYPAQLITPTLATVSSMIALIDAPIRSGTFHYPASCTLLDQELKRFPIREECGRASYGHERAFDVRLPDGTKLTLKDDTVFAIGNALFAGRKHLTFGTGRPWGSHRSR